MDTLRRPKDISIIDTINLFKNNNITDLFLNNIKLLNKDVKIKPNTEKIISLEIDGINYSVEECEDMIRQLLKRKRNDLERQLRYKQKNK